MHGCFNYSQNKINAKKLSKTGLLIKKQYMGYIANTCSNAYLSS